MPNKALRFCRWPGCGGLTSKGYCDVHLPMKEKADAEKERRYNKDRGSAASQGYDALWQKVRLAYLSKHPLCERCEAEGIITPAVLVHHKHEIKDGGARLDFDNLMSLCKRHHENIHGKDRWKRKNN